MNTDPGNWLRKKIRIAIWLTIIGLTVSGLSAFPLQAELHFVLQYQDYMPGAVAAWFLKVQEAVIFTSEQYPFMLYGYDWLGFAHLLIALAFAGPLMDPVKNQWVVVWGMLAALLTILMALVAEPLRGIPFFWSLVDATIGGGAFLILWLCNRWINQLRHTP